MTPWWPSPEEEERIVWCCFGVVFVAILLLCHGCGGPIQEAKRIVWDDVYGVTFCAAPKVAFEVPSTCGNGWLVEGVCRDGEYSRSNDIATVAVNAIPLHVTAFAHELLHAAIVCHGQLDGDPHHLRPEWDMLLPVANRVLESRGF